MCQFFLRRFLFHAFMFHVCSTSSSSSSLSIRSVFNLKPNKRRHWDVCVHAKERDREKRAHLCPCTTWFSVCNSSYFRLYLMPFDIGSFVNRITLSFLPLGYTKYNNNNKEEKKTTTRRIISFVSLRHYVSDFSGKFPFVHTKQNWK